MAPVDRMPAPGPAKKPGSLKAFAVTMATLLAISGVANDILSATRARRAERDLERSIVRSVETIREREQTQGAALDARFARIDVDPYLKPAVLVTADGVAKGRDEVVRYRALLAERDAMVDDTVRQLQEAVAALPDGPTHDQALAGERHGFARTREINATLSWANAAKLQADASYQQARAKVDADR